MEIRTESAIRFAHACRFAFEWAMSAWDLACDWIAEYVNEAIDETLSCRDCNERVTFFAKYCPCCDQSFPARLSYKAGLPLFGLPILLTALYIFLSH